MKPAHGRPRLGPRFVFAAGVALAGCNSPVAVSHWEQNSGATPSGSTPYPADNPVPAGDGGDFIVFNAGPPPATSLDPSPAPPVQPARSVPPDNARFGTTVIAERPPPPISGGTLLVTHDGNTTVAADPDRDLVYIVDVASLKVPFAIELQSGDEPGRIAEDGAGRVHVALRGGGALVTIDPSSGTILDRRVVCPAPRGVAWDASSDLVWVACATGELVALPSAGGAPVHSFVVERDLRDVIIQHGAIAVTKFRSAEVLRLAGDGTVQRRDVPPGATRGGRKSLFAGHSNMQPHVAWRAVAGPSGSIVIAHQEHEDSPIPTQATTNPYQAGGPVVESVLTVIANDGTVTSSQLATLSVLPVDVTVSPDGVFAYVVAGGGAFSPIDKVMVYSLSYLQQPTQSQVPNLPSDMQPIAVAFDSAGELLVQSREPAKLWVVPAQGGAPVSISLSSTSRDDTGHDIFHADASGFLACASCHPEGGDDGNVWALDGAPRRTPSLRGTIAGTAPYHWPGDQMTFAALAREVYTNRMGGPPLGARQVSALQGWVESIPAPPAPSWVHPRAAKRGRALFEGPAGCTNCHSGAKFTNNATVDVGTGGKPIPPTFVGPVTASRAADVTAFQVPPLVGVGWRTPLLHDGCAQTMADRFGTCSTAGHGSTGQLSARDISDLTAYLESL